MPDEPDRPMTLREHVGLYAMLAAVWAILGAFVGLAAVVAVKVFRLFV